jgi:carboxylesterase
MSVCRQVMDFKPEIKLHLKQGQRCRGSVLIFHGMTGAVNEVEPLALTLFENGYNVLCPQLPGHAGDIKVLRKTKEKEWLDCAQGALEQILEFTPKSAAEGSDESAQKIHVVGLSFGALLSSYLAIEHKDKIKSATLIAPPLRIRDALRDRLVTLFSYFPASLLEWVPDVEKKYEDNKTYIIPRVTYPTYPFAALARMGSIRRRIFNSLEQLTCPLLLLQDPHEPVVSPEVPALVFSKSNSHYVKTKFFAGGHHELPIGPQSDEVSIAIMDFLKSLK